MTTSFDNKRSSKRFDCTVPVDGKQGSVYEGLRTVDVSRDGIGFISDCELPANQKIAVELVLEPDTEPVLVMGIVKWSRQLSDSDQFRIGFRFEEVISGSRRGIDAVLENRLKTPDLSEIDNIDINDL